MGVDNLMCRCWAVRGETSPNLLGCQRAPCCPGLPGLGAGSAVSPSQICANLDAEKITSAQEELQHLQSHVPQPKKQYDLCQERAQVRGGRGLCPSTRLENLRNCFTQSFGAGGSCNRPGPAMQTAPNPRPGALGCASKAVGSNVPNSSGPEPCSAPRTPLASS